MGDVNKEFGEERLASGRRGRCHLRVFLVLCTRQMDRVQGARAAICFPAACLLHEPETRITLPDQARSWLDDVLSRYAQLMLLALRQDEVVRD